MLRGLLGIGHRRIVAQHHDELVPADAGQLPAGTRVRECRPEPLRNLPQQRVAGLVAERVVDALELVEIDEQQPDVALALGRLTQRACQELPDPFAVWKSGQRIEVRQAMDVSFGLLALRDIAHDGEHLTAAVGQKAALEMAARLRITGQRELESLRRAVQRGREALHGAHPRFARQQFAEVQRVGGVRLRGRQARDGREAMADRAGGAHQEDAVGHRPEERGVLLLRQAQRLDGTRAAQHVADAVDQKRPVDRLYHEVGSAGVVSEVDRLRVIEASHHHDRHVAAARQRADVGAGLIAVAFGHLDIEQHDIGHTSCTSGHGGIAARHGLDAEARAFEGRAGDLAQQPVVVRDEHPHDEFAVAHADLRISRCSSSRTRA